MDSPATPLSMVRLKALDGLRGIAILQVLFFHWEIRDFPHRLLLLPIEAFIRTGWLGVDLFFVLSGFLITGILCDTRDTAGYFRNFYARRALRILPLYYVFLGLSFVLQPLFGGRVPSPGVQASFWLHLANFLMAIKGWGASPLFVAHFWSLAVEEQFYLVWPSVVRLVTRRTLLGVCGAFIAVALGLRAVLRLTPLPWYSGMLLTPARLDALALGALVAVLLRSARSAPIVERLAGRVAWVSGVACVVVFTWRGSWNAEDSVVATLGTLSFDIFAASIVACAATAAPDLALSRFLSWGWLRTVGRYSYGMYVIHMLVVRVVSDWGLSIAELARKHPTGIAHLLNVGVNLGLTFGLAVLSYQLFEQRFLRLKTRFEPGPPLARAEQRVRFH